MNNYYTYPHKELWEAHQWAGRGSQTNPLAQWIQEKNYEARFRCPAFAPSGTMGKFDKKTHSIPIEEVVSRWRSEGLAYHVQEMGGMRWIAMLPIGKNEANHNGKVLLILCDVDYTSPYWSMEILARYSSCCKKAAQERIPLLFAASDGAEPDNTYIRILQEAAAAYHLTLDALYLDIRTVYREGADLADISDIRDACSREEQLLGIPVLNITGLWQNRISQIYATVLSPKAHVLGFDSERMINSRLGKRLAESMVLQSAFNDAKDPTLEEFWKQKGIQYDRHCLQGEPWITMFPLSAQESSQQLPLVVVMQEVTNDNPHATLIAMSYHYGLMEIVSAGEASVLFFALESPADNELLYEMIKKAKNQYPVDPTRVYITGHSHNGMYCLLFAQRHPELFAGIATLGNLHGLETSDQQNDGFRSTPKELEIFRKWDMPLININGALENPFALGSGKDTRRENLFRLWQNRLYYFGCPEPSPAAFAELAHSKSKARRETGLADGRISTRYLSGYECYTVDIANHSGKEHLRFVTIEGMIHLNVPIMADLSWEFLRQFSRDAGTGEILEE